MAKRRMRNYGAMLPENLLRAMDELEDQCGEAYKRCMERGSGDPERDLARCHELYEEMKKERTLSIVLRVLWDTYGATFQTDQLARNVAVKATLPPPDREREIMRACEDWYPGGTSAAQVARTIEEALTNPSR